MCNWSFFLGIKLEPLVKLKVLYMLQRTLWCGVFILSSLKKLLSAAPQGGSYATGRCLTALQRKVGFLLSHLLGNLDCMALSMSFSYMNYQLSQILVWEALEASEASKKTGRIWKWGSGWKHGYLCTVPVPGSAHIALPRDWPTWSSKVTWQVRKST